MTSVKLFLISIIALFSILVYVIQPPTATFAQQEFSDSNSTEAVTSTNDAILKSVLIISQVSVIGITFSYFFFKWVSDKKLKSHTGLKEKENNDYTYGNSQYLKRFTIMVSLCCVSIILSSTGIILISAYELSKETMMDLFSTFSILYSTSVGQVWAIRIATSSLTVGVVIVHYMLKKQAAKKKTKGAVNVKKHLRKISDSAAWIPLMVIVIVSSINLFSNSMISHSNALPFFSTFAISVDWIHFMAVSIWIGGVFYLSTILVKGLKFSIDDKFSENTNTKNNNNRDKKDAIINSVENSHDVSILLMYFSFVAIVSLTIIGITGLYLGLVHLQSIDAIFNTAYGNILIIKLSLAFPLIFLGRYNQHKIQNYAQSSKIIPKASISDDGSNNHFISLNERRLNFFNAVNRSLKIESIIGISVIVAAAFLSVTSPPSLSTSARDFGVNGNSIDNNIDVSSTNAITLDFSILAIVLSTIILILGMFNFRKNQHNIKYTTEP